MLDSTRTAIRAICSTDPSVTREQLDAALDALVSAVQIERAPLDPVVSVQDACKLCGGIDRHTLLSWSKRGLIQAVRTGKGAGRVTGYLKSSIRRFLNGEEQGKEAAR